MAGKGSKRLTIEQADNGFVLECEYLDKDYDDPNRRKRVVANSKSQVKRLVTQLLPHEEM